MKTKYLLYFALITFVIFSVSASASDFTLDVFGNANGDDTINMQDVTYTELIILEYQDATELADAKYDGEIDILDVTQIELIILGKEKEITITDSADRVVTVTKPINRILLYGSTGSAEAIKILEVVDNVIGVPEHIKEAHVFFPDMSSLPSVGMWNLPDYEAMIELDPDVVIIGSYSCEEIVDKLTPAGLTVLALDFNNQRVMKEEMIKAGYIFGGLDKAEEFIDFYEECINMVTEKTEELSDEDKPGVYYEYSDYLTVNNNTPDHMLITTAGGTNIAAEKMGSGMYSNYPTVDPEWVLEENPEIIIKIEYQAAQGYEADDPAEMIALRDSVLIRPGFDAIEAVKSDNVYVVSTELTHGHLTFFVHMAYMAKWFHPELFEDLDPQAIHQEYLSDFQHLDYDLDEHGVFVYPTFDES